MAAQGSAMVRMRRVPAGLQTASAIRLSRPQNQNRRAKLSGQICQTGAWKEKVPSSKRKELEREAKRERAEIAAKAAKGSRRESSWIEDRASTRVSTRHAGVRAPRPKRTGRVRR